jgi:hypothetical protein
MNSRLVLRELSFGTFRQVKAIVRRALTVGGELRFRGCGLGGCDPLIDLSDRGTQAGDAIFRRARFGFDGVKIAWSKPGGNNAA